MAYDSEALRQAILPVYGYRASNLITRQLIRKASEIWRLRVDVIREQIGPIMSLTFNLAYAFPALLLYK